MLSLASLATQRTWDKFGGATYIIVIILEIGLVLVQLSWVWRNRDTIRAARAEGKTFDEYVAARSAKNQATDEVSVVEKDLESAASTTLGSIAEPEPKASDSYKVEEDTKAVATGS